jgi:hypothetical protein
MAGIATKLNKKLVISPCTISPTGKVSVDSGKKFEVMLNPSSYKQTQTISYNDDKAQGDVEPDPNFRAVNPRMVNFSIIIDGTGVVNLPIPKTGSPDVKTQIDQLNAIVYKYQGDRHEPNHVRLLWGSLKFYGRLESMTINYTLFAPGGRPLRAEVAMAFLSFLTGKEKDLRTNDRSPDMTHIVEFKAGDTLPHICSRVYGDGGYYKQVARVNNITDFRAIKPGTTISFPPLR